MASFDIQSLFTNIRLDETINMCLELLFYKKRKVKGMLKKHVKELLTHAFKSSTFMLKVDGVAMGSPLGPTLAKLLFSQESKWLGDCPQQFKPRVYCRYVDDTFVIFKQKDHVTKFLNTKYRFQTFPSVETITNWKHLFFINLHLAESTLILIVSYKQNIKEFCCTRCYTEHTKFVPAICRFIKKLII